MKHIIALLATSSLVMFVGCTTTYAPENINKAVENSNTSIVAEDKLFDDILLEPNFTDVESLKVAYWNYDGDEVLNVATFDLHERHVFENREYHVTNSGYYGSSKYGSANSSAIVQVDTETNGAIVRISKTPTLGSTPPYYNMYYKLDLVSDNAVELYKSDKVSYSNWVFNPDTDLITFVESTQKYAEYSENSKYSIVTIDLDGNIVYRLDNLSYDQYFRDSTEFFIGDNGSVLFANAKDGILTLYDYRMSTNEILEQQHVVDSRSTGAVSENFGFNGKMYAESPFSSDLHVYNLLNSDSNTYQVNSVNNNRIYFNDTGTGVFIKTRGEGLSRIEYISLEDGSSKEVYSQTTIEGIKDPNIIEYINGILLFEAEKKLNVYYKEKVQNLGSFNTDVSILGVWTE
ncbi:MAG: hypothetical protein HYV33_00785 [Candidatus Kerfeldbacteria bacterium]|nr:hypothetical protein [Candidatus Kerfeldbacteria bacterium]